MTGVMTKGESDYEDKNNKRAFDLYGLMSEEPRRNRVK